MTSIIKNRTVNTPFSETESGIKGGRRVVLLDKELIGAGALKKKRISKAILSEFQLVQNDYMALAALRQTVDRASGYGTSLLFQLVYEDLDPQTGKKIVKIINECFKKELREQPGNVQFYNQIYTDIDDTMKPTFNDRAVCISEPFYPAALEFYKALGTPVTVLSARPNAFRGFWTREVQKVFPNTKVFCLFGKASAAAKGLRHYTGAQAVRALAEALPKGRVQEALLEIFDSSERDTYLSFAKGKRKNIDRDLSLRPEARGIVIGDTGEGDLLFLLMKNGGGDPLFLSFVHAISSRPETAYRTTKSGKQNKAELESLGILVVDNYVDIGRHSLKRGLIGPSQMETILGKATEWLAREEKKCGRSFQIDDDTSIEQLSPFLQYRIKLMRSIEKARLGLCPNPQ